MDFKKRMKARLNMAICFIIIGVVFLVLECAGVVQNEFFSPYGLALIVMGIARIRRYRLITKDKKTIQRQRIVETDERNVAIIQRAKSMTFTISIIFAGLAVIVFEITGVEELAYIFAIIVCTMTFIYWICFYMTSRKN